MKPSFWRVLTIVFIGATGHSGIAFAQHPGGPHGGGSAHSLPSQTEQGLFSVRSFGAFRDMVQKRDYAPKIALADAKGMGSTHAVGALSGLRGEITMIDGRFVVSYGGGCNACPSPHTETAALLGTATVTEWSRPIALESALSGAQLEAFIVARAKAAGLDMSKPFPVRLKGNLTNVAMHVMEAPNDSFTGHGSKVHMAKQDNYLHATLQGEVVGIYAPPAMQGILSHPGDPFHFHWVDGERSKTAHLDAFGMDNGSVLILPFR